MSTVKIELCVCPPCQVVVTQLVESLVVNDHVPPPPPIVNLVTPPMSPAPAEAPLSVEAPKAPEKKRNFNRLTSQSETESVSDEDSSDDSGYDSDDEGSFIDDAEATHVAKKQRKVKVPTFIEDKTN